MRDKAYRFDDILIGIDYTKKNRSISIGFGQREDLKASFLDPSTMETTQIGKWILILSNHRGGAIHGCSVKEFKKIMQVKFKIILAQCAVY